MPIEDTVMKCVMELFKGDALKFFGLKKRIVSGALVDGAARTEAVHVHIQKNISDWMLEADDGSFVHLEFASGYKKKDLRRYMVSDAIMHFKTGRPIKTLVVYTADIKDKPTGLRAGSIRYDVDAFYMSGFDGDKAFSAIEKKLAKGRALTKQDLMSIVFLPMMKSSASKEKRFVKSAKTSNTIKDKEEQLQVQAMIALLSEKFLTREGWMKIKEVMSMGEFVKSILDEGIERGIEQGVERRGDAVAVNMLKRGFDVATVADCTELPEARVLELQAQIEAEAA